MDGFDTSTMTYMATPASIQYDSTDPYSKMMMPALDSLDHQSNFDAHTFAGSEDMYGLQRQQRPLQATPSLKRFSSNFDDPFSDVVSAFEAPLNQDVSQEGIERTVDRDHKLLSFSMPNLDYVLLDYTFHQISISLSAQLHGMFFMAESPWANNGDGNPPPSELTCYRRNLFQITGSITLPRSLRYILTHEGKQILIVSQELVVTAAESTEGNAVKLISVPWKTPANINPPPSSDDKVEREPPAIPLDMSAIQELESDYATFPFQWKRLQFRIATANNGRRKELQQHFVLHLKVMANLATGGKVCIATAQSGAIIVRGRSPRNFQSRKDTPLTGAGNHVRKSSTIAGRLDHVNSIDSGGSHIPQHARKIEPTSAPIKTENGLAPPMSVASFYDPHDYSNIPQGLFQNTFLPDPHQQAQHMQQNPHQGAMTAIPADVLFDTSPGAAADPLLRGYAVSTPDLSRPTPNFNINAPIPPQLPAHQNPAPTSAPQKLSLVDEETPKAVSFSPQTTKHTPPRLDSYSSNPNPTSSPLLKEISHPAKRQATMAPPPPSSSQHILPSTFALNVINSPDESADLLYEYFPLSLDDWMPPVDAVYRPHVVHHIKPLGVSGPEGAVGKSASGGVGGFASVGSGFGGMGGMGGKGVGVGGWGSRSKRYFSEDVG